MAAMRTSPVRRPASWARRRPTLDSPERLRAWVMRIAANVHRDWLRREGRYVRTESQDEWLHTIEDREPDSSRPGFVSDVRPVGDGEVELEQAALVLDEAFAHLRSEDREVLDSYYRRDESCRQLAERYSISKSLAKVRVFRARQRLGKLLRRRLSVGACVPTTEVMAS